MRKVLVLLGDPRQKDIIKPGATFDEDDKYTVDSLKQALDQIEGYQFTYLDDHSSLLFDLIQYKNEPNEVDFVLNLCDEGFNNNPFLELHVPALLELLNIPYSGGSPQCLAKCYDKALVKGIAQSLGIPIAQASYFKSLEACPPDFPLVFPVIVKPNFGDSSFGINRYSCCHNQAEFLFALENAKNILPHDQPLLIEEFLPGKEVSLGMIGNKGDFTTLPIIEEDFSVLPQGYPKICGYEAKWEPDSVYGKVRSIPADLPFKTCELLFKYSKALFMRLECRDYARFDWRFNKNFEPCLLEVNPNPGWCWDGHLARMAEYDNIPYAKMLELILRKAEERIFEKDPNSSLQSEASLYINRGDSVF